MTKTQPGPFDPLRDAEPDEPIFTLLARDPCAAQIVREWAIMASATQTHDQYKINEALALAAAMDKWRIAYDARPKVPVVRADD